MRRVYVLIEELQGFRLDLYDIEGRHHTFDKDKFKTTDRLIYENNKDKFYIESKEIADEDGNIITKEELKEREKKEKQNEKLLEKKEKIKEKADQNTEKAQARAELARQRMIKYHEERRKQKELEQQKQIESDDLDEESDDNSDELYDEYSENLEADVEIEENEND